jgi:lysophospholipase L1-like esterase
VACFGPVSAISPVRRSRLAVWFWLAATLAGCGRDAPSAPTGAPLAPAPEPGRPDLAGVVFYDEDGDGALDPDEGVRLGGVGVTVDDRRGTSDAAGRFRLEGVRAGSRQPAIDAASLPPFFDASRLPSVALPAPAGFELALPLRLPIGANQPHRYLAFGDSITSGDGSRGSRGYRAELQARLRDAWGIAEVVNGGEPAGRSDRGADRLPEGLARWRPAYVLVLYGTNDWNRHECHYVPGCFAVPNLRRMVQAARAAGTIPVVATLPPVNPLYNGSLAAERNAWVTGINAGIRTMVREEGAVLADVHAQFPEAEPALPPLFADHVHPNDAGYERLAEAFYRAITGPRR